MKRVLSLVLAVSMVLGMFSFAFAGSNLKDVAGTEYEAAVDALVELGVVNGYTDGTFLPDKTVSRAEMAKLLVVAAGLEPAAEVAQGATRFSDVTGGWASGYINVAAEYGFIVGYPDGTFNPDAQVTYAEAVTMALRVLGYRTVVESKGTWPTNYIAKAQDLKILDDITYSNYKAGAKRGNIAKLIWNMLRTRMWDVTGESEGDGLMFTKADTMLEVKFPDYSYGKAKFENFTLKDGEVTVFLLEDDGSKNGKKIGYEYNGADFYKFVKGTEVEVLVNDKDEVLLTIVPTGKDTLVDGTKEDLKDEEYDNIPNGDYNYIYALIDDDAVEESTKLVVKSYYVYEVKDSTSGIRINGGSTVKTKDYDKKLVIKDGAKISYGDIEQGDVVSEVKANGSNLFYVVSNNQVEGKFTKYVDDKVTIGGEKYTEAPAEFVENPEKKGNKAGESLKNAVDKDEKLAKNMKGEEVVAYLDFLDRVVRIDFDGRIGDASTTDVNFYAIKSLVEKERAGVYTITLENENGENEYTFEKNNKTAADLYSSDKDIVGSYAVVVFNDDDEVVDIKDFARPTSGDPEISKVSKDLLAYGEETNETYVIETLRNAKYDKDEEKIVSGADGYLVDEDVILVTLTYDDNGTEKTSDDEYTVKFESGIEAIENIKNETVIVIYDKDQKITTPKYVVRFDDAKNTDDIKAGKVEEAKLNKLGTEYSMTIDGEDYVYRISDNDLGKGIADYEDGAILFSMKEDKEGDEYLIFRGGLDVDTLRDADNKADDYVEEVSNGIVGFQVAGDTKIAKAYRDSYDDYLFVVVEVTSDDTAKDDDVVVRVDEPVKAEDVTADTFAAGDRIIENKTDKVVFIIRGLEERDDDNTTTTSGDTTSGDTTSGDTTSGDTTSGDTTSGDTTSGDTTSGDTTSGDTVTTYTVTYAANGGSGDMDPATGVSGEYTLVACTFEAPADKEFKAWLVGEEEKAAGDTINVTSDITVTAVWQDETV